MPAIDVFRLNHSIAFLRIIPSQLAPSVTAFAIAIGPIWIASNRSEPRQPMTASPGGKICTNIGAELRERRHDCRGFSD
jgi:hypothetical protein